MTSDFEPVEVDVDRGYELWSKVYDQEYNPLIAVEKRVVERLLGRITFTDVLDAGAGTGRWALRLAESGARVTALDRSEAMLTAARAKAEAAALAVRFEGGRIDAALPYRDGAFDLVISALVFSHLRDLRPVVREMARVLRTGGHLIISDFHPSIVAKGGRSEFSHEGKRYLLPNPGASREEYLDAVEGASLRTLEVVDVPVAALTADMVKQRFLDLFGECDLCLAILARKP